MSKSCPEQQDAEAQRHNFHGAYNVIDWLSLTTEHSKGKDILHRPPPPVQFRKWWVGFTRCKKIVCFPSVLHNYYFDVKTHTDVTQKNHAFFNGTPKIPTAPATRLDEAIYVAIQNPRSKPTKAILEPVIALLLMKTTSWLLCHLTLCYLLVCDIFLSTAEAMATSNPSSRLVYGKDDALFGSIEKQQGDRPFGRVLDAGTGLHSLRWIATLSGENKGMTNCIAVTADTTMQRNCQREVEALGAAEHVDVIIGNWFDSKMPLEIDGTFDVILCDYLIGSIDGFSPYFQDLVIPKLARYLKPNGRFYIVGLQPLPDSVPNDPSASLICRIRQVRDACILLAGHRVYREYPVDWIQRQVQQKDENQLVLVNTSKFPILYKHETILKQINVGRSKFPFFPSDELVRSMAAVLDDLETKTRKAIEESPTGRIKLGFDYIVTVEKKELP